MAASPLLGFGTPSANNGPINFSILDMHGFNDDIITYNEESIWCYGLGPRGTLISRVEMVIIMKIKYLTFKFGQTSWIVTKRKNNHTSRIMVRKMNFDVLKENVAAMMAKKQHLSSDLWFTRVTVIVSDSDCNSWWFIGDGCRDATSTWEWWEYLLFSKIRYSADDAHFHWSRS